MEQYYGNKKIMGVYPLEDKKTPAGSEMVRIMFEDGTEETMPKVRCELVCTETVSDLTTVQNKLKARVGAILFSTLHEYGVKMGEVNSMADAMVQLVVAGHSKAQEILFGYEYGDLPLGEINNILLKNAKQSDNGTPSTGSEPDNADQK